MEVKQIVELIIYAMSVIFPSTISIITLVKKKYFTNNFKKIWNKIDQNQQRAIQRFDQLTLNVRKHTSAVGKFLQHKDVATRIRQISKHALDYCGDEDVSKLLEHFAQETIKFIQTIFQIGIDDVTEGQIVSRYKIGRDKSLQYLRSSEIMNNEQLQQWIEQSLVFDKHYLEQIYLISKDIVNNKNNRFLIKTQDVFQEAIRAFVMYIGKINPIAKQRIYKNGKKNV